MHDKSFAQRKLEFAAISERHAQVRRQFIVVEIETCHTLIRLGEVELDARFLGTAAMQIADAEKGVAAIRHFLPGIDVGHRAGLELDLAGVEAALHKLKQKARAFRTS